jgi:hypothetical protein
MSTMRRIFAITGLLFMLVGLLSAADVSGQWKGSFDFNGTPVPLTFDMKQAESTVTGTISGLPTAKTEIKDGKLEGENLSFWVGIDYQGNPVKLVVKGKLAGDEIKFSIGTEDGAWSTELTAKKS